MQLKGIIKNMAAKTGIKANAFLQNYMLDKKIIGTDTYFPKKTNL